MSSVIRSAARTARSGSSSWARGTPNTPTTASPMNFSTTPPWDSIRLRQICLVGAEEAGDVFGVQALPQGGGADQIAEQGGDDLALLADRGCFELGSAVPAELRPSGFSAPQEGQVSMGASLRRVLEPTQGSAMLRTATLANGRSSSRTPLTSGNGGR